MDIPTIINAFNVYQDGSLLVGITGEVALPDIEMKTTTINGSGILGDFEESVIGQFNSLKIEIPFRTLSDGVFSVLSPLKAINLTLRGSIQGIDTATSCPTKKNIRIVVRGKSTSFKPGTLKNGDQMGCSTTLELTYYMIEVDGVKKLEIDKLNSIFVLNGEDMLKDIRSMC